MTLTLALDQGTHASRAVLFGDQGEQLDIEFESVDLQRLDSTCVEQNPTQIHESLERCSRKLLSRLSPQMRLNIGQCGIATQRSTVVPCNCEGDAIGPALSWQDTRGASLVNELIHHRSVIQKTSGLPLSPHYGASKMRWMLDHYQREDLILAPLASYLLMQLSTPKQFQIDHSNAQRTQLMALGDNDWSQELLHLFDILGDKLPACVPVHHQFGDLLDQSIPVTAVSGDQNAALFSGGNPQLNSAYVNVGSGAFVLVPTDAVTGTDKLLTSIASSDANESHYFQEATINGAGTALNWIRAQSDREDWWEQLPLWLEEERHPPMFINGIGGLGSPWWLNDVDSVYIDYDHSSKTHEAKAVAVLESIIFLIQNNLDVMMEQHGIEQIFVSGGVSRLDALCQRLANLSKLPVHRFDAQESTAKGIAWLARPDQPHWPNTINQSFSPATDSALLNRYAAFTNYLKKL